MKLPLMTLLLPVVTAYDGETPDLTAAKGAPFVLADLDEPVQQPSYCTSSTGDWSCFKNGKPKCCSKTKGNCPAGHEPGCECTDQPGGCDGQGDNNRDGSSICSYSPDRNCYENGWPKCCDDDQDSCPPFQPICDTYDSNYCGMQYDYDCYRDGLPSCCFWNESDCPKQKPGCGKEDDGESYAVQKIMEAREVEDVPIKDEKTALTAADGAPFILADLDAPGKQPGYCTNSKGNWSCYKNGKPKCCSKTKGNCPANKKPGCECTEKADGCDGKSTSKRMSGSSICTWSPDKSCYKNNGRPKCCKDDPDSCPPFLPICDKYTSNYCGMSPDKSCYRDGVPSCCIWNESNCPQSIPKCGKEDDGEAYFFQMMMEAYAAKDEAKHLRG